MKDFILAALPFLITWISFAVIIVNNHKNKNKWTYTTEGMCLGMIFGLLLGTLFSSEYNGLSLSLEMLIGDAIGSFIKKDK